MATRKAKKGAKPKRKRKVHTLPDTVRGMLDLIDRFLARDKTEMFTSRSAQLWDVLTAMRGPDFGSWRMKSTTTVPIRRAAFPRVARLEEEGRNPVPADFGDTNSRDYVIADRTVDYSLNTLGVNHFYRHIGSAARVLGLRVETMEPAPTTVQTDD